MTTLLAENSADAHEQVNRMFGTLAIANTDANLTLTDVQAQYGALLFTGATTGSIDIIFPAEARIWHVKNDTGNAIVLKKSGGTGYTQTNNTWVTVCYNSDAADIEQITAAL